MAVPWRGQRLGTEYSLACRAEPPSMATILRAEEGGRLGLRMTAVVGETSNGRKYRAATASDLAVDCDFCG